MKTLTAIGLMSGTSMDGVDAACVKTDGLFFTQILSHHYVPYPSAFRNKLILLVQIAHIASGNLEKIRALLKEKGESLQKILETLTDYHQEAIQYLMEHSKEVSIDLIGLHGQTVFHHAKAGISLQVGLPERLATLFKKTVIYNFRAHDLERGGQGAPIAPIYHLSRCHQEGIAHAIVINCGGISNITLIDGSNPEDLLSFDTGPGNTLLDRYIFKRSQGQLYLDQDGVLSLQGTCHDDTLSALIKAHQDYLNTPPPKSLDIADLKLIDALDTLSLEDTCRTLAHFTSYTIADGIARFVKKIPNLWILAGGGANHPIIVSTLKQHAEKHQAHLILAHEMGWDNGSLEAELMAYAAVRCYQNLPLTYPNTTGVRSPQVGGVFCCPVTHKSDSILHIPDQI